MSLYPKTIKLNRFQSIRWKLTLSYFLVTIAALIVVEIVVLAGINQFIATRTRKSPDELFHELKSGSFFQLGQKYLSQDPPDVDGLTAFLSQVDIDDIEIRAIQIGDFLLNVSSSNVLYVMYTDAQGRLIESFPEDYFTNPETGKPLDITEIPGMTDPLRAAQLGVQKVDRLISQQPDDVMVGAIPIFHQKQTGRVVGVLAFVHRSQLQEIMDWPTIARQVISSLVFITLFTGILGTIFGFFTARSLVSRLKRLARTAKAWSQGNLSIHSLDPIEDELGQLSNGLNHMAVQLNNLLEERQEVSALEERNRLARELHDSVKQQAFAASAQLAAAHSAYFDNPAEAIFYIREAEGLVDEIRQELSSLIRNLHPYPEQRKGLRHAITDYARDCSNQSDIHIDVTIQGDCEMDFETEQTLFRIVQGAVSNVIRHSRADHANIDLTLDPCRVRLAVSDNGVGFDPQKYIYGMGLRSIEERVDQLGGEFQIISAPGSGTQVLIDCVRNQVAQFEYT